jgi:serine/threonine protein kinase
MSPAAPEREVNLVDLASLARLQHPPPVVPDHELLSCIGRGSYGGVWLARNKLGTCRAVKIVYRATFEDSRPFDREFKGIQKFEPISRSHEGLVDILQVGGTDDYFYYVMELADAAESPKSENRDPNQNRNTNAEIGALREPLRNSDSYMPRSLKADLQRRGRIPSDECVQIGLALSSALAHLHRHGLIHRDVKPSNIIFVDGVPKLADIGLVAEMSEARSFVGTEGFIPPEGPGTPQADIYSLGKVLYEISTGHDRRDFPALPADITIGEHASRADHSPRNETEAPSTSNSALRIPHSALGRAAFLELNAVVVKACKSEPGQRYAAAQEMHADLELLQRGQSVKRKRAVERRWAIARRATLVAAGLLLLCVTSWLLSTAISSHAPRYERKLTTNLDALNAYSQGRIAYNKNSDAETTNAIRFFERAIALDPNFAEAYAGLASCYTWLEAPRNWPKIREPAEKALALNPLLPEAHKNLAIVKYVLDWRWAEAEKQFELAISLDPNDGETRRAYGYYLKNMGRTREAIIVLTHAHKLDPRAISITLMLGEALFDAGQYALALKQYQACLESETNRPNARSCMAKVYEAQGLFLKAIDFYQQEDILTGEDPVVVTKRHDALQHAYELGGAAAYWQKNLELDKADPTFSACDLASDCAHLGDKKGVFEYLELSFEKHEVELVQGLKTNRAFDKYRREREFIALLRKMNWE